MDSGPSSSKRGKKRKPATNNLNNKIKKTRTDQNEYIFKLTKEIERLKSLVTEKDLNILIKDQEIANLTMEKDFVNDRNEILRLEIEDLNWSIHDLEDHLTTEKRDVNEYELVPWNKAPTKGPRGS